MPKQLRAPSLAVRMPERLRPKDRERLSQLANEAVERLNAREKRQREYLAGQRERVEAADRAARAKPLRERMIDAKFRLAAQLAERYRMPRERVEREIVRGLERRDQSR